MGYTNHVFPLYDDFARCIPMSSRQTCCDERPERRKKLGFNKHSFTMHTGLAELIYLHPFGPFRFTGMLLSPSGFPSRLVGCPRRYTALNLLPLRGNLMCAETAHHNNRDGI